MFGYMIFEWEKAYNSRTSQKFCQDNFLNEQVLHGIYKTKVQIKDRLKKMDILGNFYDLEQNSNNYRLIKAILSCGLYPLDRKDIFSSTIRIGKRSVNYEKDLRAPWNIYFIARGNIAHECTNLDDNLFTFFSDCSHYHDFESDIEEYVNNCLVKSQQPSAKH